MQDEEIPDELKRYVTRLHGLVLGSKAKNTYKITCLILNNFRIGVENMVTNQYQLPIIMREYIYHI